MDNNKYKIELGVKLEDNALSSLNGDISEIERKINPIKIKLDTDVVDKQIENIKKQLKDIGETKGSKSLLAFDTETLKKSLSGVTETIKDIRDSLGILDSKSGMKSLLSSINQISNALEKVSNQFDEIVSDLKNISAKDFNINFGLSVGKNGSVSAAKTYARNEVLPQLQEQVVALENYLQKYYKTNANFNAVDKLLRGKGNFTSANDVLQLVLGAGTGKDEFEKIQSYQKYINAIVSEASKIKGMNISSVTSGFSKTADELSQSVEEVRTGSKKTKDTFEQLKQVFKGNDLNVEGISEQLNSIVVDLGEIKTAIQGLSSGISLEGLTSSFDKLSSAIEGLVANATLVKNTLDNSFSSGVSQELKDNVDILEKFKKSLKNMGMGDEEIDAIANRIKNLGVQIETLNQQKSFISGKKGDKEALSVDISGIDKFGNAITLTEQYDIATGKLIKSIDNVATVQQKAGASTNNFVKQQKRAVSDLTNKINELNRAAIDQNASKAIKDVAHLDKLELKYDEIISAIQKMESVSDANSFEEERNNVNKLISEYKSLVREYKNAESVATSLRSKDIGTVKDTYSSKLDVLISKMRKDGVYSSGFENGANGLRSILSEATDASGLVKFLNGLDKLEAGYKRASASKKEFNQLQKVGINVSGLESKIIDLQRISPEIDNFEAEINGAKVTVKSLLDDLKQVNTQGDFSVVNSKFKAFADSAKASGIAVTESVKESKSNFEKLKSLAKEMGQLDVEISGLDADKDAIEIRDLTNLLNKLESEYVELHSVAEKDLSANQIKELDQIFANTTNEIRELKNELGGTSIAQELSLDFEKLKSIAREIGSLEIELFKYDDSDNINRTVAQIDKLQKEYDELFAKTKDNLSGGQLSQLDGIFDKTSNKLSELDNKLVETKRKLANDIIIDIKLGNFDNDMSGMYDKFNKLSSASKELRESVTQVENAYREMESATKPNHDGFIDNDRLIKAQKEYAAALEKTNNLIRIQTREEKAAADAQRLDDDRTLFQSKIDAWLTQNSAAVNKFGAEMLDLKAKAESCDRVELNHLEKEFKKLDNEAEKAGLKMQSLGDRVKTKLKEYSAYFSIAEVFMHVTQGLKDMFNQVVAIDSAMTELKKVTDETDSSYNQFLSNAASRAKEIGTTIDGLVNSTADFARLGYGFEDAQGLAEVANIYAVVGDEVEGVEGATESLISTMAAFKDEMNGANNTDFAMSIIDKYNEIGKLIA